MQGLVALLLLLHCSRIPFQPDVRRAARNALHPSRIFIGKRHNRLRNRLNYQPCGPDSPEHGGSLPGIEVSWFDFDPESLGRSQAENGSWRCTVTAGADDLVFPRLSEAMFDPFLQSLDRLKDVRPRYTGTVTCIQSTARSSRLRSHGSFNRQSLSKQRPTKTSALLLP